MWMTLSFADLLRYGRDHQLRRRAASRVDRSVKESGLERRHVARSREVCLANVLRRRKSRGAGYHGGRRSKDASIWEALIAATDSINSTVSTLGC